VAGLLNPHGAFVATLCSGFCPMLSFLLPSLTLLIALSYRAMQGATVQTLSLLRLKSTNVQQKN